MSQPSLTIRPARAADAAAMVEIYRPHIEGSWASFELVTPTAAEMASRVARAQERHDWLVAAAGDEVLGYAYGVRHRAREAYRFTVEVSAYVAPDTQGRGVGAQLYERLFERLAELGYCNAVAGVTMPNDASVAFHERMGFTPVGVYRRVGYKFGDWRDVAWYERSLREGPPPGV
jgi:L-amino acid N-acyltransferase YncA